MVETEYPTLIYFLYSTIPLDHDLREYIEREVEVEYLEELNTPFQPRDYAMRRHEAQMVDLPACIEHARSWKADSQAFVHGTDASPFLYSHVLILCIIGTEILEQEVQENEAEQLIHYYECGWEERATNGGEVEWILEKTFMSRWIDQPDMKT